MATLSRDPQAQGNVPVEEENVSTIHDLLIARAADRVQNPLLCFPRSERGTIDYDEFTGEDIDRMVDHAAKYYLSSGLGPHQSSHEKPATIALLGATDLSYIITFFALSRLGYTPQCLSPRLAPNACSKLVQDTGASGIIPGNTIQILALLAETQELLKDPINVIKMIGRPAFDKPESEEPHFQRRGINQEVEKHRTALILHSSGTTGLPKPIYVPHSGMLLKIPRQKGQREFNTFPFFHGYGTWMVLNSLLHRKTLYMYNPNLPVTAEYCLKVLEHFRPDVLHVVPYTMELLALSERGVESMRRCQRVVFSGSGCPDHLGNDLVAKGVNVESMWGATEIGSLGTSFNREPGDNAWDYIRIPPLIAKFIWMKPLGDGTYECVYLHGLPSLIVSNSDDPPNSFHSHDIFLKHATKEAWKHIGRTDDRLTLNNGEKVLPIPIEGRVRLDPLIRQCCVFGAGKSIPGMLVFRNDDSRDMSDDEFIDTIWPTVQIANDNAESFSHISKETIVPLSADVDYAKTDKESIKRSQIYQAFSRDIDTMYRKLENQTTGTLELSIPSLIEWSLNTFYETLGVRLLSSNDDFFAAGVNSLQAIQMRGLILKNINLGGNGGKLGQNVIYDTSNAARLAKHLYALRTNELTSEDGQNEVVEMEAMIKQYSTFKKYVLGSAPTSDKHTVVLTGATGSLGAHVLAQLLNHPDVDHVYCLIRGESPQERVLSALQQRKLRIPKIPRLTALTSDLSRPRLGLSQELYEELQNKTTAIIHSAWAVNFNLGIRSFEDQHVAGVQNLIQLSLCVKTPEPARFFFCSSIAAALGTPAPAMIPERPIGNLEHALPQGYARSKLVGEHIVQTAAIDAGARVRTLRIGQIVGDKEQGIWNDTEAIPLIIRSALTLRALPALDETESWLPVDILATAILDLAGITTPTPPAPDTNTNLVYNLQNPHTFSWTKSLLPALADAGLSFITVPVDEWLQKLREYEKDGGDPEKNPAVKLLDHFESAYGGQKEGEGKRRVKFELKTAMEHSGALREAPKMVEEGYVRKFVESWLGKWEGEGGRGVESSG